MTVENDLDQETGHIVLTDIAETGTIVGKMIVKTATDQVGEGAEHQSAVDAADTHVRLVEIVVHTNVLDQPESRTHQPVMLNLRKK